VTAGEVVKQIGDRGVAGLVSGPPLPSTAWTPPPAITRIRSPRLRARVHSARGPRPGGRPRTRGRPLQRTAPIEPDPAGATGQVTGPYWRS
jgi:hypothetical protein